MTILVDKVIPLLENYHKNYHNLFPDISAKISISVTEVVYNLLCKNRRLVK